jgi:hypothetical protein
MDLKERKKMTNNERNEKQEHYLNASSETAIAKAVSILCEEWRNDPAYFYAWQANIAMAFKDEFDRSFINIGLGDTIDQVHRIANQAAINFLHQLIELKK